jgi:CelD/BcsL family acetyltransferase involved in cellulose biosynthesis
LAAQGIDNVFARPGTRQFMAELLRRSRLRAEPLYELSAYAHPEQGALATIGFGIFRRRVTLCTASLTDHALAQHSPGEILIYRAIEQFCADGRSHFDMGIGEERYKSSWADVTIDLHDAFVPVTMAGHAMVAVERLKRTLKRQIRSNPTAWALVKRLRALRGGAKPAAASSGSADSDD